MGRCVCSDIRIGVVIGGLFVVRRMFGCRVTGPLVTVRVDITSGNSRIVHAILNSGRLLYLLLVHRPETIQAPHADQR
jgi:hypothetical protein